ncbi:MAG: ARC6/PARC6 family protein [Candidatus Obscuribacterales bacterium]|nr:ARC6/PARC6 family protein [Candidatus Obscuribacterales bacterium]
MIRPAIRSVLIAQMLLAMSLPAFAQQDDSSLDALWSEGQDSNKSQPSKQDAQTSKPKTTKQPASIDTSPNFKVTTGGASESAGSKPDFSTTSEAVEAAASSTTQTGSAPLCTIDAFKGSDFVKSGGWPGIGPFNATMRVPNEMKDTQDNHLHLTVADQKVTEAELCLVKQPNPASNFINIQMTADYFLEALGVKPGKISDFNKELEKSKTEVVKEDPKPLSLPAGKYQVSIAAPSEDDLSTLPQDKREKIALVIKVSSRDASSDSIKSHSSMSTSVDTTDDVVEQPPVPVKVATVPSISTPSVKTPVRSTATAVKTPPANSSAPSDALKNTFTELLKTWQAIKKTAVRNRVTSELPEVLSGKALEKQTGAIKYLMTTHKYYDMTSRGVTVNRYQELVPGKKYACFAQVKEFRRFIDDTTNKSLKDAEDTYNVNYTIEKIDGKWFISDSVVINTPQR